ncbi:HEPN domain-containing protein [Pedobacter aquatilis]|uniref:HEPN domain-containing protein n=1 Tax=Pedobacter aquatilis TaxID=351343 RepID=UPI00292F7305|nr:HEPN domain-containing protein [Pedobacter aquatilis]
MLPENSQLSLKIQEDALRTFNLGIEKAANFYYGAGLYFKENKLNMATFMLHQTCEQLYRLIILVFRNKDFKSHQLHLLRKEAALYYPDIFNIFHEKESKELKWINLLQGSYLGVRYQDDYVITLKQCIFLKEKIETLLVKVKSHLFQCLV